MVSLCELLNITLLSLIIGQPAIPFAYLLNYICFAINHFINKTNTKAQCCLIADCRIVVGLPSLRSCCVFGKILAIPRDRVGLYCFKHQAVYSLTVVVELVLIELVVLRPIYTTQNSNAGVYFGESVRRGLNTKPYPIFQNLYKFFPQIYHSHFKEITELCNI